MGYFIRLFYVCTDDPTINVRRITQRFLNGGHEVPISKIIDRYYKSLVQASIAISLVDRSYIYDNTIDDHIPQLLFRTVGGYVVKKYSDVPPAWAELLIKK